MKNLNKTEERVLIELHACSEFYGEHSQFVLDECNFGSLTSNQVKGYLADLQKKGLIIVFGDDSCYFDGYLTEEGLEHFSGAKTRTFADIAREIRTLWKKPYFGAVPYIEAMEQINSSEKDAPYLFETAKDIVPYFLSNATTWRGADARRIKKELNLMIK